MAGWTADGTINTRIYGPGISELSCPRCGFAGLHHHMTTVFDRKEDADTVVETTISGGRVEVDPRSDGHGNPSSRRDGVVISFWCEGCGREPIELCVAQHKGSTEIGWRYAPAENPG